jgi:hypothetical protein
LFSPGLPVERHFPQDRGPRFLVMVHFRERSLTSFEMTD